MSGLSTALALALASLALRTGLYYAGVELAPFKLIPLHLLFIVLIAFFSGHYLLRKDPSRGFGELLRAGFQSEFLYAVLVAVLCWLFYTTIDTTAFSAYNDRLVEGFVEQGHPQGQAREKVDKLYNPFSYAAISFFGSFLAGAFNAIAFAALHHKVLRKLRS